MRIYRQCWWLCLWLAGCGWAWGADTNAPAFKPQLPDDSQYLRGRYVYERNCQVCHGATGNGRGEMSVTMFPKPRSFRTGIFKYRSTPGDALPTNADLTRTIRGGLANTSMPIFDKLTKGELDAVVEYLKFFSRRWENPKNYAPPIEFSSRPEWFDDESAFAERARKGAVLYAVSCAACHGEKGDGKGPAVEGLRDAWEDPCPPADLRQPILRVGRQPEDINRTLVTGLAGTPMPSFNEALTDEQRWEVIAYLKQLQQPKVDGNRLTPSAQTNP